LKINKSANTLFITKKPTIVRYGDISVTMFELIDISSSNPYLDSTFFVQSLQTNIVDVSISDISNPVFGILTAGTWSFIVRENETNNLFASDLYFVDNLVVDPRLLSILWTNGPITNANIRDLSTVFTFDIDNVLPGDIYNPNISIIPLDGFNPGPTQKATLPTQNKIDFIRAGDIAFYFSDSTIDPRYITVSSEHYDFTIDRTNILVT
jgi:hypothetical protein